MNAGVAPRLVNRLLSPLLSAIDPSARAPNRSPSPKIDGTAFPKYPWDLRTIIIVFPQDAPFKWLNLNTLLGITSTPFDQLERYSGDPRDAFDLQFCLETENRAHTYKNYHSISKELEYRSGEVYMKLGERLTFKGQWPNFEIAYRQPEDAIEFTMRLKSSPTFQWWAYFPRIYYHYTVFCDCELEWKIGRDSGSMRVPALHDHGFGKSLHPRRAPLKLFRYEVIPLPNSTFSISLWTEGPRGIALKNEGILRNSNGSLARGKYRCDVSEWDELKNYAGVVCRVPRKWTGRQTGLGGRSSSSQFTYEAQRNSEPRTVLGEGFLYGFDYRGELNLDDKTRTLEGHGYIEQMGRMMNHP